MFPPPPPRPRRSFKQKRLSFEVKEEEKKEKKAEVVEEDKAVIVNRRPRRHGKDVYEEPPVVPDPPPGTSEKRKPILVQDYQELKQAEKAVLQSAASDLFRSNDPHRDLCLLRHFAFSILFEEDPLSQVKQLWNFCARRYPGSLCLMLARLLNLPLLPAARYYAVSLLRLTLIHIHGHNRSSVDDRVLQHLKPLLLNVIKQRELISNNILDLSAIASRIYEMERWDELLDYLFDEIHSDSEDKQEMALRVLSSLPEMREKCFGAYKFWWAKRRSLKYRFTLLFGSPNRNIQALTFDASVKLVRLLHRWSSYREIDDLLPRMIIFLRAFHDDGQTHFVEPRILELVELARYYPQHFLGRPDNDTLDFMFHIAATADDNSTFLMCQAIRIIKIIDEVDMDLVSDTMNEIPDDDKRSILENCVRLMFCIEDVPAWYDINKASSECTGTSAGYDLGKFLFTRLCLDYEQLEDLFSVGIEIIPQYLNSQDWRTRHAGVIAFAAIATPCCPEMVRDHAEKVVEISLSDRHPRVRWAATEVMTSLITYTDEEDVRYLKNFLPTLVTVIRSASTYPRLQLHAGIVTRHLITSCNDEEVELFLKDLVPELLKFLKQGGKLRHEAMKTIKLLALSFPAKFCRFYKETVRSLKPFVSVSLLGAQSIECLSYVFSISLRDMPSCLLNDAQEVLQTLFRIAKKWKRANNRVKFHILTALSEFCKLPHLEAQEFLRNIMPVLIQILENINPYTMKLTYDKRKKPCPEQTLMACGLLSKFAGRFQQELEPWIFRVFSLLTRLFSSFDYDVQITAVIVLPSVLYSCRHLQESDQYFFNIAVGGLVEALKELISLQETNRAMVVEMLKSLESCINICGTVLDKKLITLITDQIYLVLCQEEPEPLDHMETGEEEEEKASSSSSDKSDDEPETGEEEAAASSSSDSDDEPKPGEEKVQAARCLLTMIDTLKVSFLTHLDLLLPAVEALWAPDKRYSERVKKVAISIFNLILEDYPHKLQRYHNTYAQVVMDACYSKTPQLQLEAAHGIGLCATNRGLISNFYAPGAIDSLNNVIVSKRKRGSESERGVAYDVAVSALGKICELWRHIINGPQVVPIWLNLLPLENDPDEAQFAHAQLCRMLQRDDQDLLGRDHENLSKVVEILKQILSLREDLATEETRDVIISLLYQVGAMS